MKKNAKAIIFIIILLFAFVYLELSQSSELPLEQDTTVEISIDDLTNINDEYSFEFEEYNLFDESYIENIKFKNTVNILSVGDIMAHTIQFDSAYNSSDDSYDFYEQFKYISDKLSEKDYSIGNLETVFAGKGAIYSGENMIFNAPDNLAESVKKAGIDVLTTANNHSLDRGVDGIARTIDVLDGLGILHTGTYKSKADSEKILTFEKNGISFALLSYSYGTNGWDIPYEDIYYLNLIETNKIISDIEKAKKLGVDIVMVALHWGLEYHESPSIYQTRLSDLVFYAGADIILGTHPHVLQPFEHKKSLDSSGEEKNKFIIYSMGNFISGQRTSPRDIGMYINFKVSRDGSNSAYIEEVSVMPTWVQSVKLNNKRYMRILDVRDTIEKYENNLIANISLDDYNELIRIEKDSIEHLFSNTRRKEFRLNENNEYIIYRIED